MREIKFRGKGVNGEWSFGNLTILKRKVGRVEAGCYISNAMGMPFAYLVRPETIGQYTGLKDKDGREIYEGDVIRTEVKKFAQLGVQFSKIEYMGSELAAKYIKSDPVELHHFTIGDGIHSMWWNTLSKVIGNIYDNPELLEAK